LAQRGRGADHLEAAPLDDPVDLARDRDRERELAAAAVRADQLQEEQQRLLDGDLASTLVDEVQAFDCAIEDDAEARAGGVDDLLRLPDEAAQIRSRAAVPRRREGVRRDHLDTERAEDER